MTELLKNDGRVKLENSFFGATVRALPVAIAIIPESILFGVLAAKTGWDVTSILLIGTLGFSGSAQFAMLPLVESGVGFMSMLIVALSINSRYFPLALSTSARLPRALKFRVLFGHWLGDEAYALEQSSDSPKVIGIIRGVIFFVWIAFNIIGALISRFVPFDYLDSIGLNLSFLSSSVLLALAFTQLDTRLINIKPINSVFFIAIVCSSIITLVLILKLGTVLFWIPGIFISTLVLWKFIR